MIFYKKDLEEIQPKEKSKTETTEQETKQEKTTKNIYAKFWEGVLYPENMVDNWQNKIDKLIQYPFEYCIHNKDELEEYWGNIARENVIREYVNDNEEYSKSLEREIVYDFMNRRGKWKEFFNNYKKIHVHIIIAFNNVTTYKTALAEFNKLSAPNKRAINTCRYIKKEHLENAHNYLIHNTENAKKEGKFLYDKSERITGNGFNIREYIKLGSEKKRKIKNEIFNLIEKEKITNISVLRETIENLKDEEYMEILNTYLGDFERVCKGVYMRYYNNNCNNSITSASKNNKNIIEQEEKKIEECLYCGCRWIKKDGTYKTKKFGVVQKYFCYCCNKGFTSKQWNELIKLKESLKEN